MKNKIPGLLILIFLIIIFISFINLKSKLKDLKIRQNKSEIELQKSQMDLGKTIFITTVVKLNRKNDKLNKKTTFEEVESSYLIKRDSVVNILFKKHKE